MMDGIKSAISFSEAKLSEVRSSLERVVPADQLVITCGSYARREATPQSDMDYYSVLEDAWDVSRSPAWSDGVKKVVEEKIGKLPAEQGAFATNINYKELLENYGGSRDSNETITRRMLYLLEGEYLTFPDKFHEIRRSIISKYVSETPSDHQLAFYLLNDVVRYWRTMAVDYAQKTSGSTNPKPWAIRNIKLIFSRKLIYASGLFAIALTADRVKDRKIDILEKLFNLTPIERLKYVCGEPQSRRLLEMYSFFLENMADRETRNHLDLLKREDKSTDSCFRALKNEGHYFSRELMGLFHKTFHASHPIHMAVIF